MKKSIFISLVILNTALIGCIKSGVDNTNRVYFNIDPENRTIQIQTIISDSITASLTFDTGAYRTLTLDSAFVTDCLSFDKNKQPIAHSQLGSAWSDSGEPVQRYDTTFVMKIGNTNIQHEYLNIMNWRKAIQDEFTDGIFDIPLNDTTNIWELNFEHNYLEIHSSENFQFSENCFFASFDSDVYPYKFNVSFPLQITCSDEDTITINNTYRIDTGMPWDFAIMKGAEDFDFFHDKKDAVWTCYSSGYHKYQVVNATIFNGFEVDSMRIYTFKNPYRVNSQYLIGQNFLKRFNIFFDMKNKRLGLQPIKNFQRVVNPNHRRFYFSSEYTPDIKLIVTEIADYSTNYYKTAGLLEGDELVSINGKSVTEITVQDASDFDKDTLLFTIRRNEKLLDLIIPVNKNEQHGD